ncbi:MAG: cysteine synthase A [Nitrospina sp.]|jgi:cysteine synthase|nr:cysteine synthase A [Nitrospina sp.]MBT3875953.1 cysteine synthase A [Nitrospina sp.]MBT4049004.1 cysteine synthase A [Nitrospina sp.]MBT4557682.1 cysteine synthase A [Nitrospina sp.]MBT5653324.1 cysteine synthase A [Nitrospina sp.]
MIKSKFVNSLELIGGTPLVKLNSVIPSNGANIFAKLEFFNPGGSVKDRIALAMIEDAEKKGLIQPGSTIIEPTSGNTGIGLALVGAVKGYEVILVMSENMSAERRLILESFGAKTELSRAEFGMEGTIQRAEEMLAQNPGYFMPQQFNNPANPEVHRQTTGPEIVAAMEDNSVDGFVAGIGTGGTITGVGEVLKKHYSQVKVVGVEPATSAVLSGKPPGPHKIQGIGAGFKPNVLNFDLLDQILPVSDEDAFKFAQRMGKEEGLLVGISSGAACFAANELAKELGPGKNVVAVLPDTGERYFSFNKYF